MANERASEREIAAWRRELLSRHCRQDARNAPPPDPSAAVSGAEEEALEVEMAAPLRRRGRRRKRPTSSASGAPVPAGGGAKFGGGSEQVRSRVAGSQGPCRRRRSWRPCRRSGSSRKRLYGRSARERCNRLSAIDVPKGQKCGSTLHFDLTWLYWHLIDLKNASVLETKVLSLPEVSNGDGQSLTAWERRRGRRGSYRVRRWRASSSSSDALTPRGRSRRKWTLGEQPVRVQRIGGRVFRALFLAISRFSRMTFYAEHPRVIARHPLPNPSTCPRHVDEVGSWLSSAAEQAARIEITLR